MNRVLVVGTYREPSGYGEAATEAALALDAAGADVACRAIQITPGGAAHPRLAELERKAFPGGADYSLWVAPPYAHQYNRAAGVCVGSFYTETRPLPSAWATRANQMDAQVVPCRLMADALRASPHFRRPAFVVPVSCDPAVYARDYPTRPDLAAFCRGRFTFYTVGEYVKRKGFALLLRAFLAEFTQRDPVGLVVKTGLPGVAPARLFDRVRAEVERVRETVQAHRAPPVALVTDRLTREELLGLHCAADVFVQPSYGEAVGLPARDACFFGKTPVVTAAGGYLEYVDAACGYPVPCRPVPVFDDSPVHRELFTGRQVWDEPDLLALRAAMRSAFEDRAGREARGREGRARAPGFSRERVGARLMEVFRDVQATPAGGAELRQPGGVPPRG